MSKRILKRMTIVLIVVIIGYFMSGFTVESLSEEDQMLYNLLSERAEIMQKAMFSVYHSPDGVADINDVYDAFHQLAEIETYPILAGDCQAISSSAGTDYDKVLNMEMLGIKRLSKNGNSQCYKVDIRWYMSGYEGYYNSENTYKITTENHGGRIKLARIELTTV